MKNFQKKNRVSKHLKNTRLCDNIFENTTQKYYTELQHGQQI
jgi:hypothetical protein